MSEWDRRELCADGGCVGVIGANGLCKACGRVAPNLGNDRLRGLVDDQADAPPPGDDDAEDAVDAADAGGDAAHAGDGDDRGDDWDRRELCANGACVGVIGADGTCGTCGSPRP